MYPFLAWIYTDSSGHSQANIDKAKTLLSYSPSHTILKGIEEVIPWYVSQ